MGMFDTVTNAASAVGKPLDTASNLLAGNTGPIGANDAVTGTMQWWRGYNLDVNKSEEESAGQAPNLVNALNGFPVIEFIHFGWVHTSHSNFFEHKDLSGTDKNAKDNPKIKEGDRPRAIQFRSALEREALLLWLFMFSTKQVLKLKEDESKMGGLGGAIDFASSMFGGNKPSGGQTQSSELDDHLKKVVTAITPILKDSIVYKDVHKVGVDLNQARYDYRALLDKIIAEKPEAGKGGIAGDLMSQATSLPSTIMGGEGGGAGGGVAGTLGSIVSLTQGILFKAQDVKAKLYAFTARQQEQQIEGASNEMTYQGLNKTMNPFYPIWFASAAPPPPPPNQWGGPDDPLSMSFMGLERKLQQKDNEVRSDIQKKGNELKGFFEKAPDGPPPPGTEPLGMVFDDPPKHKGEKSIVPMKMGSVACQAFCTVLKLPQLGFAETAVGAVMGVVLEFTKASYQSLLLRDSAKPITQADLVQSAADDLKIANRLKTIALEKISFLKEAKDFDVKKYTDHVPLTNNFSLKPGGLMDKGADMIDQLVEEKVAPLLNPIIEYAMGDLATLLNDVRATGVNDKCHTMEWYLGRLPMVQAQLFSNLFFPFWTAMMKAGADAIGGPVGSALKSILSVADKMKGVVDTGRDAVAKAKAYGQAGTDTLKSLEHMENEQLLAAPVDAYHRFDDAGGTKAKDVKNTQKKPETPGQQALTDHPLKSRVDTGEGQKIAQADYNAMRDAKNPTIFKWDEAHDPDASVDGATNRTAAAGAAAGAGGGKS